jgi:hypothetical protein
LYKYNVSDMYSNITFLFITQTTHLRKKQCRESIRWENLDHGDAEKKCRYFRSVELHVNHVW